MDGWRWRCGEVDGRMTAGPLILRPARPNPSFAAIRYCTHTGRPLGGVEFVRAIENQTKCRLVPQRRGALKKADADENQGALSFSA